MSGCATTDVSKPGDGAGKKYVDQGFDVTGVRLVHVKGGEFDVIVSIKRTWAKPYDRLGVTVELLDADEFPARNDDLLDRAVLNIGVRETRGVKRFTLECSPLGTLRGRKGDSGEGGSLAFGMGVNPVELYAQAGGSVSSQLVISPCKR